MAIDYVIGYDCPPKRALTPEGILDRLKARDRARTVIDLYREGDDQRHPSLMEFEFTRLNAQGEEETRIINVQDMLNQGAELDPHAEHCAGCPANTTGHPFGCYGVVQYPISGRGERWLLDHLPGIEEPLLWLLLRQGVQELGYDGELIASYRASHDYFEEKRLPGRDLMEFIINGNQVFEMLFMVGAIQPPHAGMLLLLFGAIPRAVEADQIARILNRQLSAEEIALDYPFQLHAQDDDSSIHDLKGFFRALHAAWMLNAPVGVDA
ncbi:MAG: hypothetical protein L6Q98_09270 [Anaerolineae bacterium]|nr:hypothetical protein [Anaerolineae bacterium]NUQ06221.1 hypothetical protein [Anaerolineae bacterium]